MKIFTGIVKAKKNIKTATVQVERIVVHPTYKKRLKRYKSYQVHDEADTAQIGSVVRFVACKPYSKTKRWKLIENGASEGKSSAKETKPEVQAKAEPKVKKAAAKGKEAKK
jgi:small subunit ribosomal protein S17